MKQTLLLFCLLLSMGTARSQDYIVTKFGIKPDSTKLNTAAIQRVIDKAAVKGGTIVIPKGTFLSGALFFKPGTKLRLMEGAVLKGSDDINDYPLLPSRMEGQNLDYYAALINAYKVDNFSITGPGSINGNGLRFWKAFWTNREEKAKLKQPATNLEVHRPRLLFIWGCNDVTIKDVKLHNSGFWTTHLYQCKNVLMDNCDIRSPFRPVKAPSTDGVDIDVCSKVTIRNCYISVNDDAVCIKGGKGVDAQNLPGNGIVEDVLVENCTFGEAHSTLTLGSECIRARNITIRNCKVANTCPILRLKMRPDTYQLFENITVDNITGSCGSVILINPWKQFFDLKGSTEKPFGTIKNIKISNINVQAESFGVMEGNPNDTVADVAFKNVTVTTKSPVLENKYKDVKVENVLVNGAALMMK